MEKGCKKFLMMSLGQGCQKTDKKALLPAPSTVIHPNTEETGGRDAAPLGGPTHSRTRLGQRLSQSTTLLSRVKAVLLEFLLEAVSTARCEIPSPQVKGPGALETGQNRV